MADTKTPMLTDRFLNALNFAFRVHEFQVRKAGGKNRSYFGTHLMAVASYVLEIGGTEDEAIAAILHDTIEDQPNRMLDVAKPQDSFMPNATLEERCFGIIEFDYGKNVADIVRGLTDPKFPANWKDMPKAWRQEWIRNSITEKAAKLATAPPSVRLVKACDTLHNTRSILQERTENGPAIWKAFALGCEGSIWKAETMAKVFEEYGPEIPAIELRRVVDRIKEISKDDYMLKTSK